MNEQEQLGRFLNELIQEVIAASSNEVGVGEFSVNEFTRLAAAYLIDADEIDDIAVCYYKARGMQINGYNINEEDNSLDLFISIFNQEPILGNVTKSQVETAFKQAESVFKKALTAHYASLEESSEVYDMFQRIYELRNVLTRGRIFLLTDGVVNTEIKNESSSDISVSFHVWDIQRIHRFASSGKRLESIEIDFPSEFGATIPCLPMADPNSDYKGYLAVIPGEILAGIYGKYGSRLLERNVRSFLQVRGNVNKGIRKTILEEPHRFFAYNNGISATADEVVFVGEGESVRIGKIKNLQIVNGGQTTASLYHTAKKDKASLKDIYVQAKLSVVPSDQIDGIVPLISRYANSQNKVSDADFYANDPFHVKIEELSRTTWAPATTGTNKQTKWFYERARGQYLDAKGKESTPARKRQFEVTTPNRQKFTKTDLAKYENTWMQLPYQVSLGAQKNFNHFSIQLKERGRIGVDGRYFERLIAKAILFKQTEKIVSAENYGGYRANIVTYSLAWLSHHTSQCIDLDTIWKEQQIAPALQEAIRTISAHVREVIISPPNARNITEWCKRKECWNAVCALKIPLGGVLDDFLIKVDHLTGQQPDRGIETPDAREQELIAEISNIPAQTWFSISKWAKETNNLQPWQRSLSFSIGRALASAASISRKQAEQGKKIMNEATALGFQP